MPKYSKNLIFRGKGTMFNIPVRVSSTITENKSPVHDVCLDCSKGFVGQKRYCKSCNIENTKDQIGSGLELGDNLKVFSKDELDKIKIKSSNLIIKGLTETEKLDLSIRQNQKSYYLYPDKKDSDAKRMYAVIYNGLKDNNRSMIVTWKVSTRSSRDTEAVITPINNILVIQQLCYKEELNEVDEEIDLEVSKEEKIEGKAFLNLIPEVSIDDIVDEYQIELDKVLSGKPETIQVKTEKTKKSLFGLTEDQIKKAEAELQSKAKKVVKQLKETPVEDVAEQVSKKTKSETEIEVGKD